MELILTHVNQDFDSLAATVAAGKVYPRAKLIFGGSQSKSLRDFVAIHRDLLGFTDHKSIDPKVVKRLIVVDTRIAERLGELEHFARAPGVEVFVFDHHPPTSHDMQVDRDFSRLAGAATTILVDVLRRKRLRITPIEATLFALGIHEDTGSLTYPTATGDDVNALTYLMARNANLDVISEFLNYPLNRAQHEMLHRMMKVCRVSEINGLRVIVAALEAADYAESASLLTHKLRDLENADVIFTVIKTRDRAHIIARSRVAQVDVGEILADYGGGGHPQAASAVSSDSDLPAVRDRLLAEVERVTAATVTAGEIMGSVERLVTASTRIREAQRILNSRSDNELPVFDGTDIVGFISEAGVARAYRGELSHAPVTGFMQTKVVSIPTDMPLFKVEELFTRKDIERLPVVDKGKTVGIVSRSDMLGSVHGDNYLTRLGVGPAGLEARIVRSGVAPRVRERLKFLPLETWAILKELGAIAERQGVAVYLVGGIVRDLLLGRESYDLDVVVEGDGIEYAANAAERLGGGLTSHPRFRTAVVRLPHFRIDIATARAERYLYPAALPEVESATIKKDLGRRDFTVNAMALALDPDNFGEIMDFFGGERDLEDGLIRVLHAESFIEDPTRIFRAVRFGTRMGFRIEDDTNRWIRDAVKRRVLTELSRDRLRDEFVAVLTEPKAWQNLKHLRDLGVLEQVFPAVSVDSRLETSIRAADRVLSKLDYYFRTAPVRWLIVLIALAESGKTSEIIAWARQHKLKKAHVRVLEDVAGSAEGRIRRLASREPLKPSELHSVVGALSPEQLVHAVANSGSARLRRRVTFALTHLSAVKTVLDGRDLARLNFAPSPEVGSILKELLSLRLDGKVKTRADELEYVRGRTTTGRDDERGS